MIFRGALAGSLLCTLLHGRQLEGERARSQSDRSEVIAKRKGFVARRSLKEASSKMREPMNNNRIIGASVGERINDPRSPYLSIKNAEPIGRCAQKPADLVRTRMFGGVAGRAATDPYADSFLDAPPDSSALSSMNVKLWPLKCFQSI